MRLIQKQPSESLATFYRGASGTCVQLRQLPDSHQASVYQPVPLPPASMQNSILAILYMVSYLLGLQSDT